MERFGEKLRFLRKQRGMTLKELVTALDYKHHGHINRIETGKRQPSVEFIIKVSHFVDVLVDTLVKDELEVD